MTLHEYGKSKRACKPALDYAKGMTIEQFVNECDRGDWILWLAQSLGIDLRKLTLAKAHCANLVRHLMRDERSTKAVDVAISFGNGVASREELYAAATDAAAAAAATDAAADDAAFAADAADVAAAAADFAADVAAFAAAAAAFAADDAAFAARKETLKKCADICREHIGQLIIEKFKETTNTN